MEQIVVKEQGVFLITDGMGDIPAEPGPLGMYYQDTRFLSRFELLLNNARPPLLDTDDRGFVTTLTYGEIAEAGREGSAGPRLPRGVVVTRTQFISAPQHGAAGILTSRITVVNHDRQPHDVVVTLALGADFDDMFKVRGFFNLAAGTYDTPAVPAPDTLVLGYTGGDGKERYTVCRFAPAPDSITPSGTDTAAAPRVAGSAVATYALALPPRAEAVIDIRIHPTLGPVSTIVPPSGLEGFEDGLAAAEAAQRAWLDDECTGITLDHPAFNEVVQQSLRDLRLLVEEHATGPYVAAGIPWFAVPFGRDGMIVATQMLMANPRIAVGTLRYLARHQGQKEDPSRDEDPGKIMHEMRAGESVTSGVAPFGPYYGSVDATPLFLVLLGRTLRWCGDAALAQELAPAARAALAWLDRYGDVDGDGFVEFQRKAGAGISNQGWKDSGDSLQFPDGTYAVAPVALVEVQGYVYEARLAGAALLRMLGDEPGAAAQEARAAALRERFNSAFWLPDERFLAQALDAEKRAVPAVTSNAGHCLWSGIVDDAHAADVAGRLLADDMCSGWGIRTLSTRYPSYSPLSYHNGSVWPHDVSLVVAGLKRSGHDEPAARVAAQVLAAGTGDPLRRLPELYGGLPRARGTRRPVPYPVSCSPQAWSAGSALLLVQSILGLDADAAAGTLTLRPLFPEGVTCITLRRLHVGAVTVDVDVRATPGGQGCEVVLRRPGVPPHTVTLGAGESITLPLT